MVGVAEDADASRPSKDANRARDAHQVHPDDRRAFGSYNTAEKQRLQNLFQGVRVFVWLVDLTTLLSGAVASPTFC